jgi:hypothetical protein
MEFYAPKPKVRLSSLLLSVDVEFYSEPKFMVCEMSMQTIPTTDNVSEALKFKYEHSDCCVSSLPHSTPALNKQLALNSYMHADILVRLKYTDMMRRVDWKSPLVAKVMGFGKQFKEVFTEEQLQVMARVMNSSFKALGDNNEEKKFIESLSKTQKVEKTAEYFATLEFNEDIIHFCLRHEIPLFIDLYLVRPRIVDKGLRNGISIKKIHDLVHETGKSSVDFVFKNASREGLRCLEQCNEIGVIPMPVLKSKEAWTPEFNRARRLAFEMFSNHGVDSADAYAETVFGGTGRVEWFHVKEADKLKNKTLEAEKIFVADMKEKAKKDPSLDLDVS